MEAGAESSPVRLMSDPAGAHFTELSFQAPLPRSDLGQCSLDVVQRPGVLCRGAQVLRLKSLLLFGPQGAVVWEGMQGLFWQWGGAGSCLGKGISWKKHLEGTFSRRELCILREMDGKDVLLS